jgi:hypothetical protein
MTPIERTITVCIDDDLLQPNRLIVQHCALCSALVLPTGFFARSVIRGLQVTKPTGVNVPGAHPARVRLATAHDLPGLAPLMEAHGFRRPTQEWWDHLWSNNPAYDRDWPPGWVIEAAEGRIVGFLGNIPLKYFLRGRQLRVAASSTWVVDKDFRSHSLYLVSKFIGQRGPDLLLNTTANANASQVFSAMRINKVPLPHYDIALFWVTSPWGFARSVLRKKLMDIRKKLIGVSSVTRRSMPLASPLTPRNLSGALPADCGVREYRTFDGSFDRLWATIQEGPFLVRARDSVTLNWHFRSQLEQGGAWAFGIEPLRGTLQSYAILVRQDIHHVGLTRVQLVDFQTTRADFADVAPLLRHARKRAADEGVHMVEAVGFHPRLRAALEDLRPWRRRLSSWLFFYKTVDSELDADLKNLAVWNPSFFDGDGSL